jgi:hypothetical protein
MILKAKGRGSPKKVWGHNLLCRLQKEGTAIEYLGSLAEVEWVV